MKVLQHFNVLLVVQELKQVEKDREKLKEELTEKKVSGHKSCKDTIQELKTYVCTFIPGKCILKGRADIAIIFLSEELGCQQDISDAT